MFHPSVHPRIGILPATSVWILQRAQALARGFPTTRYLEPQTTIYKWLFQLDDEPNLYIENGCFTISIHL